MTGESNSIPISDLNNLRSSVSVFGTLTSTFFFSVFNFVELAKYLLSQKQGLFLLSE